jgi:hypothetical protein
MRKIKENLTEKANEINNQKWANPAKTGGAKP